MGFRRKKEHLDPMFGGMVSDKSMSVKMGSTSGRAIGSIKTPHFPIGSTSAKTLFIIFVYVFALGCCTMAFQTSYASFNPTSVIDGSFGTEGGGRYLPDGVFGSKVDEYYGEAEIYLYSSKLGTEWYPWSHHTIDGIGQFGGGILPLDSDDPIVQASSEEWSVPDKDSPGRWKTSNYFSYTGQEIIDNQESENWKVTSADDQWWHHIGTFWDRSFAVFGYIMSFLTFNFVPGVALPPELVWIPFLLVLPVYIYICLLLLPIALELLRFIASLLHAIAEFVPF